MPPPTPSALPAAIRVGRSPRHGQPVSNTITAATKAAAADDFQIRFRVSSGMLAPLLLRPLETDRHVDVVACGGGRDLLADPEFAALQDEVGRETGPLDA